ncbi:MAG: hypothetical protein J4O08_08575, partial [Chloroflexi bacterium]|nr:hypothetical protein [Chloroflexota bacterium]
MPVAETLRHNLRSPVSFAAVSLFIAVSDIDAPHNANNVGSVEQVTAHGDTCYIRLIFGSRSRT